MKTTSRKTISTKTTTTTRMMTTTRTTTISTKTTTTSTTSTKTIWTKTTTTRMTTTRTTRTRKRTTKTTSNSTRAAGRRQRGVALILVLWTLAALAVLAAEFARAMHDEAASTRNFKESTHGRLVALAGINEVILALKARREAPEDQIESQNDIDNPDQVRSLPQGDGQWVKATFRGNAYEVRVLDEAGRIPLNSSKTDATLLRLIFDHLEIDESEAEIIADSIVDWRDEDDLHQPNGAESEYYE